MSECDTQHIAETNAHGFFWIKSFQLIRFFVNKNLTRKQTSLICLNYDFTQYTNENISMLKMIISW